MRKIGIVIALCAITGVAHAEWNPYQVFPNSSDQDVAKVMAIDRANKENQICVEYGAIEGMAMTEVTKNCDKIRTDTIRNIKKYYDGKMTHAESCELWKDC